MLKYAIIENEKVINIVVSDLEYAESQGWVVCPENAGIDWDYIDGEFVDNRPVPEIVTPPSPTKEDLLAQLLLIQEQLNVLP